MHSTNDLYALPSSLPTTAFAQLDQEHILEVKGVDATRFLQGQLTCDVTALQPGSSTLGARCNPKGRMQSSFRLLKLSEERYLLAIPSELMELQQQDLAKYAAFFKVQLSDISDQWARLGLWGENTAAALAAADIESTPANPDQGLVLPVGDDTFEVWLPLKQLDACMAAFTPHARSAPVNDWNLQLIRLGIGHVQAGTRESFIPQMLNLQQLGGVSFHKGCYTGQEIVARMQYLGKLKRRMYRLTWAGSQLPAPGTPVQNSSTGQSVGEVVLAAQADGQIELLAVLQSDAAELSTLIMHNADEPPLMLATLPYEQQMVAEATEK